MFRNVFGRNPAEEGGEADSGDAQPPPVPSGTVSGVATGSGFDPTGLERAAKAARELDSSRNAREALAVVKEQERTKQAESRAKAAELEAYSRQLELEKVGKQAEENRQTLAKQAEQNAQLEVYKDKLERKRNEDNLRQQLEANRYLADENRQKEEESVARQEAIRRKTVEYEAELRQGTEIAKVRAEAEGRIAQERANHDLHVNSATVAARENRRTVLESIRLAGTTMGEGLKELLADKQRLATGVGAVSALALGVYGARAATGVFGRFVEARLGKPSLVRETSRLSPMAVARHPIQGARQIGKRLTHKTDTTGEGALSGIILHDDLEARLKRLAVATANAKRNRAPYRNVLLHGPPGTGKTLFAKSLAKHSGLEYAIMTGGDVAPLGRDAVTELHKVFDWAQTSRKGLLLFIDEADAFLRSRSNVEMSEELRSALNAFLYRTGESSDRYMVVFASNAPELFDWAANDRIDDILEFHLPGEAERLVMLELYFNKYVKNAHLGSPAAQINVASITKADFQGAAKATAGFSGREISKLAIAWQAAAFGSAKSELGPEVFHDILKVHLDQKHTKHQWASTSHPEVISAASGPGVGLAAAL